jgi:hypothetical protein
MCDCEKCKNNSGGCAVRFTTALHDCSKQYTGGVPFAIMQVLGPKYAPLTPEQCETPERSILNTLGYAQNYYSKEFLDPEQTYISKQDQLPKITAVKTYVLLLIYNSTD